MKNILVVANDNLREHAVHLVHAISNNEETKASYFTPQKFKDSESQITGKNYVIFIGENEISKPYISLIKRKYEEYGIVWGYDGTKAAIIVEDIQLKEKEMKKEIDNIIDNTAGVAATLGTVTIGSLTSFIPAFWIPFLMYVVYKYFMKKKRMQAAEKLQYKLGILFFLEKGFDNYLSESLSNG